MSDHGGMTASMELPDDIPHLHSLPAGTAAWYRAYRDLQFLRRKELEQEEHIQEGVQDVHGEHLRHSGDSDGGRGDDLGMCEQGLSEDDAD